MSSTNGERPPHYGAALAEPPRVVAPHSIDELARALSDGERKDLLGRIERALSVEDGSRQRIIRGELQQERRVELILSDMSKLNVWERLRFWLKRVMSGGRDQEVFVRFRLDQARDRVKERCRDSDTALIDFENRQALPGMAESLRELARKAFVTRPFFETLWRNTESLRSVLDILLSRRVPEAKSSLSQFCTTQELQDVFRATESRSQLKKLVLDRVSTYVDQIPPSVMEEIENGLKGLYLLKDVALFDFDDFFVQFQSSAKEARSKGDVSFRGAAAHRVLNHLEELYLALYSVSRINGDPGLYPELIDFYYAVQGGQSVSQELEIPASSSTPVMRNAITELAGVARDTRSKLPLVDVIRYFRNDPYYRFLAYVPRLKIRDFYYSNLKIKILDELDRRFNDIRMGVLGRLIQDVFPSGLLQFEYFHPEIQAGIQRSGIGRLEVYRSLQVIHSFSRLVYRGGLHEFMRVMGKILPVRARQAGADFTLLIAGLDDVEEKVRNFDLSFSPESDEGKTFYRYRYSTSDRDPVQLTAYRGLVTQKGRDAKAVIEKFLDQVVAIYQSLMVIKRSSHGHLNERYRSYESTLVDDNPFDHRLNGYLTALQNTEKILRQMIIIENEA